jgi:hypothetical protein
MPGMGQPQNVLRALCGWTYASKKFSNNWIIYALWLFAVILVIAQPIVLAWEFREWGPDRWTLMKLYPHQLLIPPMCFVFVFWAYSSAVSFVWAHQRKFRRKIMLSVGIACVATAVYLPFELTRTPVMLLELKPNTLWSNPTQAGLDSKSTINTQTLTAHYLTLALINRGYDPVSKQELSDDEQKQLASKKNELKGELMRALDYQIWKGRGDWSITRWLYAATFYLGIASALSTAFALKFVPTKPTADRIKFIFKIMFCFGGYGLWVAARFYFNNQIKAPVFGAPYKYPPWDTVLWGALVIAAVVTALLWLPNIRRSITIPIIIATGLPGLLGVQAPECLDGLIGVTSQPSSWFVTFSAICLIIYWLEGLADAALITRQRRSPPPQRP